MLVAERETEAVLRDVVAAISSALRPGAMVALPVLSAILLQCGMPLPAAILCPSPLLLPGDRLPLGALGLRPLLLSLLGLLPLRLLRGLRVLFRLRLCPLRLGLLGLLPLRLLRGLRVLRLRLLPLRLRLLGLLPLRLLPLLLRLLLRLVLLFRLVLRLCGWRTLPSLFLGGDNRPEQEKQGGGTGSSNELHSNNLH